MTVLDRPRPAGATGLALANARVVTASEVVRGSVRIEGGVIASIDSGASAAGDDLGGDYLLPGLVDIHTDHFEKHVYPRAHVRWDYLQAAIAHDAQIIGGGVTTVFDSLCVGATYDNPERREILGPMIDALETAGRSGMLKADHRVHLRCEISDGETPALVEAHAGRGIVRLASVMEHLPGVRQSRDVETYLSRVLKRTGQSEAVARAELERVRRERGEIGRDVRPRVVELVRAAGLPLMSHDDTDADHVDLALGEGMTVSEFPCTLGAARRAREVGMKIVAGAPNLLRGGSQSGNVAVRELMAEDLVDILASDYVPRSILDCVFRIAGDPGLGYDLPAAVRMAASNPAAVAGLTDRGEIAVGKRADLVRVGVLGGQPFVKEIWREGIRVY